MRILWAVAGLVVLVVAGYMLDFLSTTFSGVWNAFSRVPGGGVRPPEGFGEDVFYKYVFLPSFSFAVAVIVVWAALRIATAIRARG